MIQPGNVPNLSNFDKMVDKFGKVIDELYDYAKTHETDPDKKRKLYKKINNATSKIYELINHGETKEANRLARAIIKRFNKHNNDGPQNLINWIFDNTTQSGKYVRGASETFHLLTKALRKATKDSIPDKTIFSDSIFNFFYSYYLHEDAPIKIDSASRNLIKSKDATIHGYKDREDPIFPPEIMNLIVHQSVAGKPRKDFVALQVTSKKTEQQVANAYDCPLTKINITTADQAIEYAKKFGRELRYLDISGIDFSDAEKLKELIKHLPKLNTFIAHKSSIDDAGAKVIAESETLIDLRKFILSKNSIGPRGGVAFARSKYLTSLTHLDLSENRIRQEGTQAIANSKTLTNLEILDLSRNEIGNEGLKAIAPSETLKKLTNLYLRNNMIEDEAMETFALSGTQINLIYLDLAQNQIGDRGVTALVQSIISKNLQVLYLGDNQITDEGVKNIALTHFLQNLVTLFLTNNLIGDEAMKDFVQSLTLTNLKYLYRSRK